MEVLKGTVLDKYFEHYSLGFMQSLNCQVLQGVGGMIHMMLNFDWIPLMVMPFVSGVFWLLANITFFNYRVIVEFGNSST